MDRAVFFHAGLWAAMHCMDRRGAIRAAILPAGVASPIGHAVSGSRDGFGPAFPDPRIKGGGIHGAAKVVTLDDVTIDIA
ncbi:hypothetical protein H845_205 [Komagataeibacter xylinus E25]|nr:hypothetical protein H845_205 [Komagataeibacter xylinus E25]